MTPDPLNILVLGDFVATTRPHSQLLVLVEHGFGNQRADIQYIGSPAQTSQTGGADAVIVMCEERNRSYSAGIKAVIEGMGHDSLAGKPIGLISYGSIVGGRGALDHLRVVVSSLRGLPVPGDVTVSIGELSDARSSGRLLGEMSRMARDLLDVVARKQPAYTASTSVAIGGRINPAFPVSSRVEGAVNDDIAAAVNFIKQKFHKQDLSLDMVADHVFISRYHFSRKFREQTGRRFIDYVIMVRLTAARRLLIETEMTVTAITAAVGYRDLSNFERSFKKLFMVPPSQYRLRYKRPDMIPGVVADDGLPAAS